jgi:hypothetical protein
MPIFSYIFSARITHRNLSPSIVAWRRPHRKHVSRVRLRVHWSVSSTGCGADDIENSALSIVACWIACTELLPGNMLIISFTIRYNCYPHQYSISLCMSTQASLTLMPHSYWLKTSAHMQL